MFFRISALAGIRFEGFTAAGRLRIFQVMDSSLLFLSFRF